jgi:hypothetical protein
MQELMLNGLQLLTTQLKNSKLVCAFKKAISIGMAFFIGIMSENKKLPIS